MAFGWNRLANALFVSIDQYDVGGCIRAAEQVRLNESAMRKQLANVRLSNSERLTVKPTEDKGEK